MIRKQVGDLSSHTTKYSSPALTQKVGEGVPEVHVEDVTAGVTAEGDVSAADDVVPTAVEEPSIPSPTPHTSPPQPSQDIPSTSQVQLTPPQSPQAQPQSPQHQPQPLHDAGISMDLLQNLLDTCTTLTRRVEHLEQDKVAQALKITKLKQRVKKLERRNKASKLKRLKKAGSSQRIETFDDIVMDDVVVVEKSADVDESTDVQGMQAESQAQIYQIDLEDANKVLSMQDDEGEPAELQEVVEVVTTAKLITEVVTAASVIITAGAPQLTTTAAPTLTTASSATRRRKEVVIRDPQETATPSTIIHSEAKSKDKGKGILRKQKEDNAVKRYQALKRKPQTEAQARKNMMIYLRNVVGFRMDYFKGMTFDDIRLIFEKHFDSNVAFLQKTKEQMDEEDSKGLKRLSESQKDKAATKQKLDEEVPVVDYEIYNEHNKPYFKIKRADGSHQLYLSFLSMLRNIYREDLEALLMLVKERFAITKPKNFSDDFLLITLGDMFEKPDIHAQIWKNQRSVHGQRRSRVGSFRVLWCADYHIHYNIVDFAGREEISTYKFHSRSDAQ
uniref:Putative ribonuclease H-like domain-containing protein n=1 Tax=Tanacetum cinerariifolium TaxID=118510 RepID=A0A6L2JYA3_TANCI|nr:putative ribonuclease H-like domain-containing protein [Tanacetum cinerariifolium]